MHALTLPYQPAGLCLITDIAVISATGVDASSFLHSQLTNDIKSLSANHACLAGYCTPKGRMLASMLVLKTVVDNEETLLLEVPGELQEALQKRLQMFVMRAKVKLSNLTPTLSLLGILGDECAQRISTWFPILPSAPYQFISNSAGTLLRLADANQVARYQWIADSAVAEQIWPALRADLPALPQHVWARTEILAGIPHISLATQEKFVPQMINYELIGGVNFKKGCYPGQEIVARTHYLGKQKRRMVLAHIASSEVLSGMEVFASSDSSQPCGMVVNAELDQSGGSDCLIEIKTTYLQDEVVRLSSGEICQWLAMPYPLPADSADEQTAS